MAARAVGAAGAVTARAAGAAGAARSAGGAAGARRPRLAALAGREQLDDDALRGEARAERLRLGGWDAEDDRRRA